MKPLLSIAIATKNRVSYCIKTIETILGFKNYDFELVIQDNTDTFELGEYIKNNISDSRLKYNYTPPPFSSIANFNAVLDLCSGEYVCLLGDDDGIIESIFDVVQWANNEKIDSVCPRLFVNYIWPNDSTNGRLVIPNSSEEIWYNHPKDNLQDLVDDGILLYTKFNLPKLYHGIIKKSCLDQIKDHTGYYLGGLSPDIYASIALSAVVKKNVIIDFPITIAGACPKSTTVDNIKGKHSGDLKNAPHLRDKPDYIWDEFVPEYYSVQTIWADSALHSLKEFEIEVDLKRLNRLKILAGAINDNKSFKEYFTKKTLENLNMKKADLGFGLKLNYYRLLLFLSNNLKRVKNIIPSGKMVKAKRIYNVIDIFECSKICNEIYGRHDVKAILSNFKGNSRKI